MPGTWVVWLYCLNGGVEALLDGVFADSHSDALRLAALALQRRHLGATWAVVSFVHEVML